MTARHFNPAARGLAILYRANETNHCPGCGRSHWHIGRVTAECAFCATTLPLEASDRTQTVRVRERGLGGGKVSRMLVPA